MKEFSLPLMSCYARPVIKLYQLTALIDTRAIIPLFSIYTYFLESIFSYNFFLQDCYITLFGGYERGAIYSISEFKLCLFIFQDFDVFIPNEPRLNFPFLLGITLFRGTAYSIDTINQKFTVRMTGEQSFNRAFKIKDLDGQLFPQIDGVLFQDVDIELEDCQIFF